LVCPCRITNAFPGCVHPTEIPLPIYLHPLHRRASRQPTTGTHHRLLTVGQPGPPSLLLTLVSTITVPTALWLTASALLAASGSPLTGGCIECPPRFQILHCLRNPVHGGTSLFVDAFAAAETLRATRHAPRGLCATGHDAHHVPLHHRRAAPPLFASDHHARSRRAMRRMQKWHRAPRHGGELQRAIPGAPLARHSG
jgi:Taurine catabolism dioxygenase TauD, TfdA family